MSTIDAVSPLPATTETAELPARSEPSRWGRWRQPSRTPRTLPYALVLPGLAVLIGVLGYPVYFLIQISFQEYGQPQLFNPDFPTEWVGLDNYVTFFTGDDIIPATVRTLGFTAACVALTIGFGLGIALLMQRMSSWVRIPLLVAMMFAWAMPFISAIAIFRWLFDFQYGVVNWLISWLPGVDFTRHHWFLEPVQGFGVITAMVVWQAIPFVAVTLYAGLTQVPRELVEAARIDGAGRWAVFRHVTYPVIKPVLTIVTALSIIWDFGIVIHLVAMLSNTPRRDYFTLTLYSYMTSFAAKDFGLGAAAAVITVVALIAIMSFYIRRLLRIQGVD